MNTSFKIGLCLGLAASVPDAGASPAPSPATVENAVRETELATVKLTPRAEQRLGIELEEASRKQLAGSRLFGGEILVPLAPKGQTPTGYFPLESSTADQLLRLSDQQAVADGEIEKSKVQLDAAQRAYERAQKLIQADAGSVRALEEAETQLRLAEKALEVADARRALLGAPVAEALRGQRVWVRVPVYVGELKRLDPARAAWVGSLAARPGETNWVAKPVPAPPSANPLTATVDLFYEVEGAGGALSPGQRVSVRVPMRGAEESLVVPWAAILHDIHGGTWVYECVAPQTFVRRRVQVTRIVGADAVLAGGLEPGSRVVTDGAAELFGTEFGVGK